MYESRSLPIRKKPVLILDKKFSAVKDLESGSTGYCIVEVEIVGDRLISEEDGTDRLVKTLLAKGVELVNSKNIRIQVWN